MKLFYGSTGNNNPSFPVNSALTIVKSGPLFRVFVGNSVEYRLIVTNTSNTTNATNVIVTDTLASALQFTSATSTQGICSNMGNVVTCNVGTLAPGASTTITILSTALSAGRISNSANVTSDNAGSNSSNIVVTNIQNSTSNTLAIQKTISSNNISVGDNFQYQLLITNNSNATINNLSVVDNVASNVNVVSSSSTVGSISTTSGPNGSTQLTNNIGSLAAGQSVTMTINAQALTAGTISNYATGTGSNISSVVSNTVNTTISQGTPTNTLSIVKSVSDNMVSVGECFNYQISVTNNTSATVNNLVVTDCFSDNVCIVSTQCNYGYCSNCGNHLTANIGTLAAGASALISITVKATCPGVVSNYATLQTNSTTPITSNTVFTKIFDENDCIPNPCPYDYNQESTPYYGEERRSVFIYGVNSRIRNRYF